MNIVTAEIAQAAANVAQLASKLLERTGPYKPLSSIEEAVQSYLRADAVLLIDQPNYGTGRIVEITKEARDRGDSWASGLEPSFDFSLGKLRVYCSIEWERYAVFSERNITKHHISEIARA